MEQLEFIRNAGETRRFHGWPVLRPQTVAEHSFHVAMIVWVLAGQEEPGIRLPLIMAALTDDLAEWITGDPPSPFSRAMEKRMPGFRDTRKEVENEVLASVQLDWGKFLTDEEQRILKLADYIDGAMYCIRERAMGNQLISPAMGTFMSYLPQYMNGAIIENEIWDYLVAAWEKANGDDPRWDGSPSYYTRVIEGTAPVEQEIVHADRR